jgi:release factor glutamine methyltransferase
MDDITRKNHLTAAAVGTNISGVRTVGDLGRKGAPQGLMRRALRAFIFFFSYHLILKRSDIRTTKAAGFRLTVRPTVFHPKFFISSERFAEFLGTLDLTGKHVCEIGTGSGILALAAARSGAELVVASDINPAASLSANENSVANGLGGRVTGVCMNLMAAMPVRPLFDVILSSPPKHAGEPRNVADRGWHAGPAYRDIAPLFDQARERLKPGGYMYVMVSSDTDLDLFSALIDKAGFDSELVREYSLVVESLIIFKLTPR